MATHPPTHIPTIEAFVEISLLPPPHPGKPEPLFLLGKLLSQLLVDDDERSRVCHYARLSLGLETHAYETWRHGWHAGRSSLVAAGQLTVPFTPRPTEGPGQ